MKTAGIFGASGYTGVALARLLLQHALVDLVAVNSRSYADRQFQDVFGSLRGSTDLVCEDGTIEDFAER